MTPIHVFICGLHRSGTSILNRIVQSHPDITGFSGTGASEDEGQHLQAVIPHDGEFGGPGSFCFDPRAALTERDLPRYEDRIPLIRQAWERHWDGACRIRVEKSPPNLIRSRFLQAAFPGAKFLFIVRHPAVVALATKKWSDSTLETLIDHWVAGHRIMLKDTAQLEHVHVVRYEDIADSPTAALSQIWKFIGVRAVPVAPGLFRDRNRDYLGELRKAGLLREFHPLREDERAFRRFAYIFEAPYVRDLGRWSIDITEAR